MGPEWLVARLGRPSFDNRFESWRPPPLPLRGNRAEERRKERVEPKKIRSTFLLSPAVSFLLSPLFPAENAALSRDVGAPGRVNLWLPRLRTRGTHPPAQQTQKVSNWPESLEIA
jgi:hypothetical protein